MTTEETAEHIANLISNGDQSINVLDEATQNLRSADGYFFPIDVGGVEYEVLVSRVGA